MKQQVLLVFYLLILPPQAVAGLFTLSLICIGVMRSNGPASNREDNQVTVQSAKEQFTEDCCVAPSLDYFFVLELELPLATLQLFDFRLH